MGLFCKLRRCVDNMIFSMTFGVYVVAYMVKNTLNMRSAGKIDCNYDEKHKYIYIYCMIMHRILIHLYATAVVF